MGFLWLYHPAAVFRSSGAGCDGNSPGLTACSFLFLYLYEAGDALYCVLGRTSATMYIFLAMNLINIVGDYIGVQILHADVAGAAGSPVFPDLFGGGDDIAGLSARQTGFPSLEFHPAPEQGNASPPPTNHSPRRRGKRVICPEQGAVRLGIAFTALHFGKS